MSLRTYFYGSESVWRFAGAGKPCACSGVCGGGGDGGDGGAWAEGVADDGGEARGSASGDLQSLLLADGGGRVWRDAYEACPPACLPAWSSSVFLLLHLRLLFSSLTTHTHTS